MVSARPVRAAGLLIALLCLLCIHPVTAEGRADWQDYAWQQFDIASCDRRGAELTCPPYHQRWDWKRNQWVDMTIAIDLATGRLRLTQQLTNHDRYDDDNVCVTMLVIDADGHTVMAHHQNWHSLPGTLVQRDFALRSSRLAATDTVHIGSKQCRQGPHQDDAVYAAVRAAIRP